MLEDRNCCDCDWRLWLKEYRQARCILTKDTRVIPDSLIIPDWCSRKDKPKQQKGDIMPKRTCFNYSWDANIMQIPDWCPLKDEPKQEFIDGDKEKPPLTKNVWVYSGYFKGAYGVAYYRSDGFWVLLPTETTTKALRWWRYLPKSPDQKCPTCGKELAPIAYEEKG